MSQNPISFCAIASLLLFGLVYPAFSQESATEASIFDIPAMRSRHTLLKLEIQQSLTSADYEGAAGKCREAIKLFPEDSSNHYILASCLAQLGQNREALLSLEEAIDCGFNDVANIQRNGFLRPLKKMEGFEELVRRAPDAQPKPNPLLNHKAVFSPIKDGIAVVDQSNTEFRPKLDCYESFFEQKPSARLEGPPVTRQTSEVGTQVQEWFFRGLGAGLKNHLYDNHDGGHSSLPKSLFPQLNRIEFCDAAKKRRFDHGLQVRFFYNAITIGNSSEAMTGNSYWRSLPRLAYTSPRAMSLLNLQYQRNHLYVYPEHNDHDPTHGDVFPANTPYLLISQGSSGSDQKFLQAVALTLASFHPKTKRKLAEGGALMAAVQMILRRTNQQVESFEDYLTGKAHPTVFDGNQLDVLKMITLAQAIKPEMVPPVVQLSVREEDESILGVDYFDDLPRVKLFDTPGAISRICRSTKNDYRMVVSAKQSFDLNQRPLTIHWRVLRGDAEKIQIKPLNSENTSVEIIVPYQEPRPFELEGNLISSRIDVGAFAHNGAYYSAPAFVSLYFPRNEKRVYNNDGQIESVEYFPFEAKYEDPVLITPRQWVDLYKYDERKHLIGWVRSRGDLQEHFTPDGALVIKNDELGRPAQARTVVYRRSQVKNFPNLEQVLGPEILFYQYRSPEDQVGRIVKRVSVETGDEIRAGQNMQN